ncbi:MAG: TonB-dependent receptor [Pseudomonadales bacterium]|nr:TonB-dependent receptor [Pseudomonadales bacterium]
MMLRITACCAVLLIGWLAQPATAQEEIARDESGVIEEIITTARKRSEPLQDTPVASTVLGGQALDLQFHGDLKTLPFPAPNVNIATVSAFQNAVSVAIRGIENAEIDSTIDPVVGIFVDGVYLARPVASSMDLFDVEQIEVLRGPQGTLFGRNTSAGALQIRTRRPSGEFGVRGKLTAGEYGRTDIRAAVDIPIIQGRVNAKVAIMKQQMDGYFDSAINGRDLGAEDILAVRPIIQFTPNDRLDITLIGEYHRNKSEPRPQQNESPPARLLCVLHGFCGFPFGAGDEFEVESVDVGFIDATIWGITGEANYQTDNGVWTVIANYRDTEEDVVYDPDAVLYPMFLVDRKQPHEQWSTEIRFASTGFENFEFITGVYFFHQEYDLERNTTLGITAPDPLTALLSFTGQDHDAYSIFGEVNYFVSDALTLTFGARYSDEEKDFYQEPFGPAPNAGARTTNSESWNDFGPKFGVRYQFSDDLMTYFSYQKGFKSGGFNGRCGQTATCLLSFDPEEVDGYELGFKADWFDRRLRTNVAIFHSEYQDLQRTAIVPLPPGAANPQETVTDNAAEATIQGIELELTALIGDLQLDVSIGVLDAEYDDFCADIDGAEAFSSMPASDCGGSVIQTTNLDDPGGAASYLVDEDRTGFDLGRAPKLNYSINATYDLTLGNGGSLVFNARYTWVDDLFTDDSEVSLREDTELLDLSVSYEAPDGKYRISVFGKNVTDEIYVDSRTIVPPLFDTRAVSAPERWGVGFAWNL